MAYCHRYLSNSYASKNKTVKALGSLTTEEVESAFLNLIRMVQGVEFRTEILYLQGSQQLSRSSKIFKFSPFFICCQGILRVSGRLLNADISFNEKHPIILPQGHALTLLIMQEIHKVLLHSGAQAMLAFYRQRY